MSKVRCTLLRTRVTNWLRDMLYFLRSNWSTVVLYCAVAAFATSAVSSVYRLHKATQLLSVTPKSTDWYATQLQMEHLKFMRALDAFVLGLLQKDDLVLRLDILWSRIPLLLEGSQSRDFRSQSGVKEMVLSLQSTLEEQEARILMLKPGQRALHAEIRDSLSPYFSQLQQLVHASYYNDWAAKIYEQAYTMQREVAVYLIGLLVSGSILIALLIRQSRQNRKLALYDTLTGLPNRKRFQEQVERDLALARRNGTKIAIHFIDLDRFKEINDTLGHAAGDELLRTIGERLKTHARPNDLVARLGGDEFAIIQSGIDSSDKAMRLASRIIDIVSKEILISGRSWVTSASIGITVYPDDALGSKQLLTQADMAMYQAKSEGRKNYRFFEATMNSALQRRETLADDLTVALQRNQLQLVYQPIFDLRSRQIVGAEALVRWHHTELGYIPPSELIAIGEQYGHACQIGEWVLCEACHSNRAWQDAGMPCIQVAVNVSPAMVDQKQLTSSVRKALSKSCLEGKWLAIEMTEDLTIQSLESGGTVFSELLNQGVEIALDDFGTGYSSLSYLKDLPAHKLKIDRSFVSDLQSATEKLVFVKTIIKLGHSLGKTVIAEGIETELQYRTLLQYGCHQGQGYYFCHPVEATAILKLLSQQRQTAHSA